MGDEPPGDGAAEMALCPRGACTPLASTSFAFISERARPQETPEVSSALSISSARKTEETKHKFPQEVLRPIGTN